MADHMNNERNDLGNNAMTLGQDSLSGQFVYLDFDDEITNYNNSNLNISSDVSIADNLRTSGDSSQPTRTTLSADALESPVRNDSRATATNITTYTSSG